MSAFWLDRPVLVTGATGLVGGWLVKRLVELRAEVVCLVRDQVPGSELQRSGLINRVKVVRGDVEVGHGDADVIERSQCHQPSVSGMTRTSRGGRGGGSTVEVAQPR